jgi:hypothetical protein
MDAMQADALRRAESMKLFERDGYIHFGVWREWWAEPDLEKREDILASFRKESTD